MELVDSQNTNDVFCFKCMGGKLMSILLLPYVEFGLKVNSYRRDFFNMWLLSAWLYWGNASATWTLCFSSKVLVAFLMFIFCTGVFYSQIHLHVLNLQSDMQVPRCPWYLSSAGVWPVLTVKVRAESRARWGSDALPGTPATPPQGTTVQEKSLHWACSRLLRVTG